jgi:hypothetical protein
MAREIQNQVTMLAGETCVAVSRIQQVTQSEA